MPIGDFERKVMQTIAGNRNPESHVAGATVLHQKQDSGRSSRDMDLFHDTQEALQSAYEIDKSVLEKEGYEVRTQRIFPAFIRAMVVKNSEITRVEWLVGSSFRFFPVERDPELGYRLSYWDAATNKVLAAAGRSKIRDYYDLVYIHRNVLPLGALLWAAIGKDGGYSPGFLLDELSRAHRYTKDSYKELQTVEPIDAEMMKKTWIAALEAARELFDGVLRQAPLGCLFLDEAGKPVCPTVESLPKLKPHFGSVRGAWPRIAED